MNERRTCPTCGDAFDLRVRWSTQVYCSQRCRQRAYRGRHQWVPKLGVDNSSHTWYDEHVNDQRGGPIMSETNTDTARVVVTYVLQERLLSGVDGWRDLVHAATLEGARAIDPETPWFRRYTSTPTRIIRRTITEEVVL